jgi:hypothetical protein
MAKLSCIMVTQKGRIPLALRAIHNLVAWDHPEFCTVFNPHELIIVHDMDENPFSALPFRIRRNTNCRCVSVDPKTPLHERFRRGVKTSEGDWITFLDDDVLYHSMRLDFQMEVALETPDRPCVFSSGMYFFHDTAELFVVNAEHFNGRSLGTKVIPYSAVFPKDYFIGFPPVQGHPIANCLNFMGDKDMPITVIPDQWKWVCVGIRGDNLHGYEEFRRRVMNPKASRPARWLRGMWPEVMGVLECYNWDGNVSLCGHDGCQGEVKTETHWPPEFPEVGTPDDGIERIQEDVSNG